MTSRPSFARIQSICCSVAICSRWIWGSKFGFQGANLMAEQVPNDEMRDEGKFGASEC